MFDDLNRTIAALLKAELPADIASQLTISFATPDDTFPPNGLQLPALNLFLFEVQENTQLRDFEPSRVRSTNGTVLDVRAPVRVDCHYLVTAAVQAQLNSEQDEHRILGAAMKVLFRHRVLPDAVLQGVLVNNLPPVRALAAQPGTHPSGIDLWQAIKGKPRASLHYTLTVAVDLSDPETIAPPVTSVQIGGT